MLGRNMIFEESKLKLERAQELIDELDAVVRRYAQEVGGYIKKEYDGIHTVIKVGMTQPLPKKVALIAGDAIHNIRSSLDFLAVECVRLAGHPDEKKVYFAFGENETKFRQQFKEKKLRLCHPEIAKYLEHEVCAHKDQNPLLWALHQSDISDKHGKINPVFQATILEDFHVINKISNIHVHFSRLSYDEENGGFVVGKMVGEVEVELKKQPFCYLLFGPNDYLHGKDVKEYLEKFLKAAKDIVDKCEELMPDSVKQLENGAPE